MTQPEQRAIVVLVTAGSPAAADTLARRLVEERLAACVSATTVRSTYRWQGGVESEDEVLLLIKTAASRWDALVARVGELHDYDVPELVALPAGPVETRYLEWLLASSAPAGEGAGSSGT